VIRSNNSSILVSGASGFIGNSLVPYLAQSFNVKCLSIRPNSISDINFEGFSTIVHLAGLAHQMSKVDDKKYFIVNRDLTNQFAKSAKLNGIKHFIFVSSTKVYSDQGSYYDESSDCEPSDSYGESKKQAENLLKDLESDLFKVAIVRPPLVYGPHVKGNLNRLIELIDNSPLLPLGGIDNKRSMVFVQNLNALIKHIIDNSYSGTYIAGDQRPYSTTELATLIKKNLNASCRMITLPKFILNVVNSLKPSISKRLFDSLVFDNSKSNIKINFTPPFSFESGIKEMTDSYLSNKLK